MKTILIVAVSVGASIAGVLGILFAIGMYEQAEYEKQYAEIQQINADFDLLNLYQTQYDEIIIESCIEIPTREVFFQEPKSLITLVQDRLEYLIEREGELNEIYEKVIALQQKYPTSDIGLEHYVCPLQTGEMFDLLYDERTPKHNEIILEGWDSNEPRTMLEVISEHLENDYEPYCFSRGYSLEEYEMTNTYRHFIDDNADGFYCTYYNKSNKVMLYDDNSKVLKELNINAQKP